MDITLLFKACIKTIKTKNRAIGQTTVDADKSRILSSRAPKQDFTFKTKDIVQQITRLYEFLMEHQKAYLNFANYLSGLPEMSDAERDKIDTGAQRIINSCSKLIGDLEKEILIKYEKQSQVFEHQQMVIMLIKSYLKQVCKMYSEQRAIRVQRTIELKKLSQIDLNSDQKIDKDLDAEEHPKQSIEKPEKHVDIKPNNGNLNPPSYLEDEELSPEELQMFELENSKLYNELNSLTDEVRQIESKVVKIAELQQLFTEKVLEQDKDMDRVATMVVGSTENVKDANDMIRQAIKRNAGLRVWVLFFLLVMSFSLLFLDWYND